MLAGRALLCGALLLSSSCLAAVPSINVALEAAFPTPPFLLELIETAALERPEAYFALLDAVAEGKLEPQTTDKDLYDAFKNLLSSKNIIGGAESVSSFELGVSLHVAAPRIEAVYQYYRTAVESRLVVAQDAACPIWVDFEGKQYCSPTMGLAQQDYNGPSGKKDLLFDHVYNPGVDGPLATFYADLQSPHFAEFHTTLKEKADAGELVYKIRYRPSTGSAGPLTVSGYGVSMQLKRTDYIVIDDRETSEAAKAQEVSLDTDDLDDLKPLAASDLARLGLKASSFIVESENPLDTLVNVNQDFPKHSSAIAQRNASDVFMKEFSLNREAFLPPGWNVVWMNGLQVDARSMNAYSLLSKMRAERALIERFQKYGLKPQEAISLMTHDEVLKSKSAEVVQRYDYRDTAEGGNVIIWLNDIEKDRRYNSWPVDASALLQRVYPGQMPLVRRDIHNLVVPLDLSDLGDLDILVGTLSTFVQRMIPVRFGFVPTTFTAEAKAQAKLAYYLVETYGLGGLVSYFSVVGEERTAGKYSKSAMQIAAQGKDVKADRSVLSDSQIQSSEEFELRVAKAAEYYQRLGGRQSSAPVMMNGVAIAKNDNWMQAMSERLSMDLQSLQQKVYESPLGDEVHMAGLFLANATSHRNPLIVPESEKDVKIIDIGDFVGKNDVLFGSLPRLNADESGLKQFWSHIIIVADLDSDSGAELIKNAVEFHKHEPEAQFHFLHNPQKDAQFNFKSAKLYEKLSDARDLLFEAFDWVFDDGETENGIVTDHLNQMAASYWADFIPLVEQLGLLPGQNAVVMNGRVLGPLGPEDTLRDEDFGQLLAYERRQRYTPFYTAVTSMNLEGKLRTPLQAASLAAALALSSVSDEPEGIYEGSTSARMNEFKKWQHEDSAMTIGDPSSASIQFDVAVDPISEIPQRWLPLLKTISEMDGVSLRVFMNPQTNLQELPIKRFYRYSLASKPTFEGSGELAKSKISFSGLPKKALLNLAMDVPPAWLVSPKRAIQDLDNIKLSAITSGADIDATYQLDHILIEGHSREAASGTAPRGAKLILGSDQNPRAADTLIMANLGYFQFRANPGHWNIELDAGPSQEIYKIDTIGAEGFGVNLNDTDTQLTLMDFQGKTLFPRLARKPGHEVTDVLAESAAKADGAGSLFGGFAKLGQQLLQKTVSKPTVKHADINIFSVASGHLYERMLNIMMLSVMKNTKHSVKFWFIEQFLSPSFKESIPHLAAAYGFEYELITYKWPHWLRAQKEKQREIWGYKILFLDVLFPLTLEKVIFVDADQIVRTDMYQLVTHDLEGAPYGFTPMCDSRTEMEGFRFWKQGYWKSSLHGNPYHISALYVVDLKRFRQMAAGDRLRQSYHTLSADPNSLSNLDQDLPNNLQGMIPIHSLPQEWLWCETWCSDESLAQAKTIDLCNNPLTKEPKLDRARRQIPEWTLYDDEIAEVFRKAKAANPSIDDNMIVPPGQGEGANVQEELDQTAPKAEIKEEASPSASAAKIKDEL